MQSMIKHNNIEYFMPFLFCNDLFIPVLDELLKEEKNPIKYVYGTPSCEWGVGPRFAVFKLDNLKIVERYFKNLKEKYNIIPTLTFTNLKSKDRLNDEYSNSLLDVAYSLDCRFIVSTEELFNHIKSRYPDAKIHSSVILPSTKIVEEKGFNETKFYNKMLDKCEVVVIRPEYVMDNLLKLDKLLSDISRVEVLINQNCHYNCPHHRAHYNFIEEIAKNKNKNVKFHTSDNQEEFSLCPKYSMNYRSVYLTQEQVEKAIELGVKKIKIQGRSLPFDWLFDELYKNFFNNSYYSKKELEDKIDKILANMLKNDRKKALVFNLEK